MKRVLVAITAALALSLVFGSTAEAKCGVTCLNRKVKQLSSGLIKAEKTIASLSKTVAQQGQQITAQNQTIAAQGAAIGGLTQAKKFVTFLEECLFEAPLTQYGDPEGSFGYHFNTGTEEIETSALDITAQGDPIDAWFLFNACESQTTLALNRAGSAFPGKALSSQR